MYTMFKCGIRKKSAYQDRLPGGGDFQLREAARDGGKDAGHPWCGGDIGVLPHVWSGAIWEVMSPPQGTRNSGLRAEHQGTGTHIARLGHGWPLCQMWGRGAGEASEPSSEVAARRLPGLPHALDAERPWVMVSEKRMALLLRDLIREDEKALRLYACGSQP